LIAGALFERLRSHPEPLHRHPELVSGSI